MGMLDRTYEKLHGDVRLDGLNMPNILHIPFYFKSMGIKENSIRYMVCIELTYISIECWVVNSNAY